MDGGRRGQNSVNGPGGGSFPQYEVLSPRSVVPTSCSSRTESCVANRVRPDADDRRARARRARPRNGGSAGIDLIGPPRPGVRGLPPRRPRQTGPAAAASAAASAAAVAPAARVGLGVAAAGGEAASADGRGAAARRCGAAAPFFLSLFTAIGGRGGGPGGAAAGSFLSFALFFGSGVVRPLRPRRWTVGNG